MFARITTYQLDPAHLEDAATEIDRFKAQVRALPGAVDVYSAWRADGAAITVAIYESQDAAEAAAPQVKAIWANAADLMVGAPNAETYENVVHFTA